MQTTCADNLCRQRVYTTCADNLCSQPRFGLELQEGVEVVEEADESEYWLEVIKEASLSCDIKLLERLLDEINELIKERK